MKKHTMLRSKEYPISLSMHGTAFAELALVVRGPVGRQCVHDRRRLPPIRARQALVLLHCTSSVLAPRVVSRTTGIVRS